MLEVNVCKLIPTSNTREEGHHQLTATQRNQRCLLLWLCDVQLTDVL